MAVQRLGVSNPSANTNTLMYTSNAAYLTSVLITNKGGSDATATAWVVPSGALSSSQWAYVVSGVTIPVGNTLESHRFALSNGDAIYVSSNSADLSFSVNGMYDSTASIDQHVIATTNVHGIADTANLATLDVTNNLSSRLIALELDLGILN